MEPRKFLIFEDDSRFYVFPRRESPEEKLLHYAGKGGSVGYVTNGIFETLEKLNRKDLFNEFIKETDEVYDGDPVLTPEGNPNWNARPASEESKKKNLEIVRKWQKKVAELIGYKRVPIDCEEYWALFATERSTIGIFYRVHRNIKRVLEYSYNNPDELEKYEKELENVAEDIDRQHEVIGKWQKYLIQSFVKSGGESIKPKGYTAIFDNLDGSFNYIASSTNESELRARVSKKYDMERVRIEPYYGSPHEML